MNTPDDWQTLFDQADNVARLVARVHAQHRAGSDTTTAIPPAALDRIVAWYAAPLTRCDHLEPDSPQPVIGFLADPGHAWCIRCAKANAVIDAALPSTCDLCGERPPVHGLEYPLGEVGHLIGQTCDECLDGAEATT